MVCTERRFLDDDALAFGSPSVRLQLNRSARSLSISSRSDEGAWTTHADMQVELRATSTSPAQVDAAEIHALCPESVVGEMYYTATVNDYRGEFRALTQGWAGSAMCLALVEYERQEIDQIHLRACAFLDACSHAGLWWQEHARRPFFAASVDAYHVNSSDRSSNRVLWSVTSQPTERDSSSWRIFDGRGGCLVHTVGGQTGFFAHRWLEERRARRHTYQVRN